MYQPFHNPTLSKFPDLYSVLIPKNHLFRKLRDTIDFYEIIILLKDKYSMEVGALSAPLELLLKLLFLKSMFQLSDRDLVERARYDMAFKFFLGLNPEDELIHPSTLSKFRTIRLKDTNFMDLLIQMSVKYALRKKVLDPNAAIIVDGTHTKSNFNQVTPAEYLLNLAKAIRKALYRSGDAEKWKRVFPEKPGASTLDEVIEYCRALIEIIRMEPDLEFSVDIHTKINYLEEKIEDIERLQEEYLKEAMAKEAKKRAQAAAKTTSSTSASPESPAKQDESKETRQANKQGPAPCTEIELSADRSKPLSFNDKPIETKQMGKIFSHDPDAKVGHKTSDTSFFGYKEHVAMAENGIVVAAIVTSGQFNEGAQLGALVQKARDNDMEVGTVIGDMAYSGKENLSLARAPKKDGGEFKLVSKLNPMISAASLDQERDGFTYNKDAGMFVCPMGHMAVRKEHNRSSQNNKNPQIRYFFDGSKCAGCPRDGTCHKKGTKYHRYTVTIPTELHKDQQKFQETDEFKAAMSQRYKIEAKNSDLKHHYGLKKAISSGLFAMQVQGGMAIYAANMMRAIRLEEAKKAGK